MRRLVIEWLGPVLRWSVHDEATVDEDGNLATFPTLHEAECFVLGQGYSDEAVS